MSGLSLADPFGALSLVLRIGSVGVVISSLESLVRYRDLGPGGLLDGAIQITRARWLARLAAISSARAAVVLTVLRLVAGCVLIGAGGSFEVARAGAIVVAVTTLALRLRTTLGIHASGTMVMITFTAAALGLGVGTRLAMEFALGFIAAQTCLSYFVAGSAKLRERTWRSGVAIPRISGTLMWGNGHTAMVLQEHRELGLVLCWVTILGECSIPLTLAVPLPVTIALLACALLFHVVNAVMMGLNSFVWAFASTYPAVFFCWYFLH